MRVLNEDLFDLFIPVEEEPMDEPLICTEPEPEIPDATVVIPGMEMPVEETKEVPESVDVATSGPAGALISLIKDEWEAVEGYNSAIVSIEDADVLAILKDIVNEENNHIGMLQKALERYSPNAVTIQEGEAEAIAELDNAPIMEGLQEDKELDIIGEPEDEDFQFNFTIRNHPYTERWMNDDLKQIFDYLEIDNEEEFDYMDQTGYSMDWEDLYDAIRHELGYKGQDAEDCAKAMIAYLDWLGWKVDISYMDD